MGQGLGAGAGGLSFPLPRAGGCRGLGGVGTSQLHRSLAFADGYREGLHSLLARCAHCSASVWENTPQPPSLPRKHPVPFHIVKKGKVGRPSWGLCPGVWGPSTLGQGLAVVR